jgi:hypothetical protein
MMLASVLRDGTLKVGKSKPEGRIDIFKVRNKTPSSRNAHPLRANLVAKSEEVKLPQVKCNKISLKSR